MNSASGTVAVFDDLPRTRGSLSARVLLGTAPRGAVTLSSLTGRTLDDWLAREVAGVEGADAKLAAAYLMGRISWSLAELLGGLALRGLCLTGLAPGTVALLPRQVAWEEDGESGISTAYDVVLDVAGVEGGLRQHDPRLLAETCAGLLTPLVAELFHASRLPKAALWRLAGDALSASLLAQGKATGCEEQAMAIAEAVLHQRGSPLFSRQTHFVRIEMPECAGTAEWFRARGGCCRYYTTRGGEYCTTCVLRDPESRNDRLRDYLRRKHVAA